MATTTNARQLTADGVAFARVASACLLLVVLASCSSPVGLSSSTIVPEQSALTYFQWLQSASGDAIQAELRSLSRSNPVNPPLRDVKRGLLLSLRPNATAVDVAEAIRVLTTITNADSHGNLPADYLVLAGLWLQVLQERGDLREYVVRQSDTQASLDSVRERYDDLEQRIELLTEQRNSLEKQNALLEQQNKLMQQQIDALTIIEQQLVEQDQGEAGPKP